MATKLAVRRIETLGFDWPKHAVIQQHAVMDGGDVDLDSTLAALLSSKAFYQEQLNAAFNFKWQHGADYSDFTDRRDDYARTYHALAAGIAYLEQIIEAANAS